MLPCPGASIPSKLLRMSGTSLGGFRIEKFFVATDELEDKKLKMLGWAPAVALQAIKDGGYASQRDKTNAAGGLVGSAEERIPLPSVECRYDRGHRWPEATSRETSRPCAAPPWPRGPRPGRLMEH